MIPNERFCNSMTPWQLHCLKAFDAGMWRFAMLEWARRHRKTTLLINLLNREACRYENRKYVYIAPTDVAARNIVWDDPNMLRAYLPDPTEMAWKLNEVRMTVHYGNGSVLKIGGSDKPDALRGIDADGAGVDEWAQCQPEVWTEILRPIVAAPARREGLFRWAAFAYTPKGMNHAPIMFDKAAMLGSGGTLPDNGPAEKMLDGWYVSRINAEKVGLIDRKELERMKQEVPLAMYEQEMCCARVTQEEMTLITSAMLHALSEVNWELTRAAIPEMRKIVSIDPAFGGDVCKIKGFENTRVVYDKSMLNRRMTHEVVFEGKRAAQQIGTHNFIVDCIGNGKGVADGLAIDDADYHVQYYNSAEKPEREGPGVNFENKRAEAYYCASELIRRKNCEALDTERDRELIRQLPFASRYKINSRGRVQILPKDKIREELGKSPDEADCYVNGLYGLQFVEPESEVSRGSGAVGVPSFIKNFAGAY